MDRTVEPGAAAPLVASDAPSQGRQSSRPLWLAAAAVGLALGAALALWARFGSAVFVDALGVVASCF